MRSLRLPSVPALTGVLLSVLGALPAQVEAHAQAPLPRAGDPAGVPQRAASAARHGFLWRFAGEHVVGTFANGDPWVVGPVEIVAIEPKCVTEGGRVMHGSMIDPDPTSMLQGYDSALFGDSNRERYRDERNVALGVGPDSPLKLAAGSSLISVVSRADRTAMPQLQSAAVLTCVAEPPPPDAFRPPYVRGDRSKQYRAVDLDFHVLRSVRPTGDAPQIDAVAPNFEKLWLDHFPEWPTRYAHPADNMPDYGRDQAAMVGSGALMLNLDVPDAKKRDLLIRMVQIGIDLHAALRAGCHWQGIGGHGHGRKLPILLAGLALHDDKMLAIGKDFPSERTAADAATEYFGEDGQTFFVRETSPGVFNWNRGGYTRDHDGLPEWGFVHCQTLDSDHAKWDQDPYRRCCTANGWVGEALAARLLGLQEAWAHPAYFEYLDRYMQVKHSDDWHRAWVSWHASMWDAWRSKT